MKNDIRVTYPLWMMGFIALLGVFAYGINSPKTEFIDTATETSLTVQIGPFESALIFGAIFVYLIVLTIFVSKVKQYNKNNPQQKISMFSIRPPEYLEADEGMTYITRRAVQKVYTFYSLALPALATVVIIFTIPRLLIIYAILGLAFTQYGIYYAEVRKHFKEETE
ncbi:hypothetical protein [Planomicrobium sp. MB-3u-38]|uniref:hypothetical protein n=1 Tax=Planomicrobium sp. MB-3u-38 TaxID=2058318 RepID=UPI000C7B9D4A|nr:hypothetical protein [Planomicrobium sp. MB-3u-38]PKH11437.1 hypothetical protein CXF70_04750 [Planomicrobium sp. MB-3u-38]